MLKPLNRITRIKGLTGFIYTKVVVFNPVNPCNPLNPVPTSHLQKPQKHPILSLEQIWLCFV